MLTVVVWQWRGSDDPRLVHGHLSWGERMVKPSSLGYELLGFQSSERDGRGNGRSSYRVRADVAQSAMPRRVRRGKARGPRSFETVGAMRPVADIAVRGR